MSSQDTLMVNLHGQPIGTLSFLGGERTLFVLNEQYIQDKGRPTLGLRFKDSLGSLISEFRPYRIRLMPFFSNLLPEGHLRKYLAERAGVHEIREFFLLKALGQDLPGAITVFEDRMPLTKPRQEGAAGTSTTGTAHIESGLHFSLAGVQMKFSAIQTSRFGLTIPASGVGGDWIVKLPSREFDFVPENEFSMMSLARMVGIDVPDTALVNASSVQNLPGSSHYKGQQAFAIRRFDRGQGGKAVHIEDFAQVFDVYAEEKYKKARMLDIAKVLISESGLLDIAELIRRITFNVLIGNGDMHLKNWSIMYPDKQQARLAPAYDFVSTIQYIQGDQFALKFSRGRRFSDFNLDEIAHFSAKTAIPENFVVSTVAETVALFMQAWATEKKNLPADQEVISTIDEHLRHLPILRQV